MSVERSEPDLRSPTWRSSPAWRPAASTSTRATAATAIAGCEEGQGVLAGPWKRRSRLVGRVRIGAVRVVVGVGALAGEDAEEHPHVGRGARGAGRAAQPHPGEGEVVFVDKG